MSSLKEVLVRVGTNHDDDKDLLNGRLLCSVL